MFDFSPRLDKVRTTPNRSGKNVSAVKHHCESVRDKGFLQKVVCPGLKECRSLILSAHADDNGQGKLPAKPPDEFYAFYSSRVAVYDYSVQWLNHDICQGF